MNEDAYDIVDGISKLLCGLFVAFVLYKTVMYVAPLDGELGVKVIVAMLIFTAAIIVALPLASATGMLLAFLWGCTYAIYNITLWIIRRIRGGSARPLP